MPDTPIWLKQALLELPWLPRTLQTFGSLRLGLPCCGIGSTQALSDLGVPHTVQWAYDSADSLRCALAQRENFHIGRDDGDILKITMKSLAPVDVILSGPPCPPWSRLGRRQELEDVRARVFERVIRIVNKQKKTGLLLAIIENVAAIAQGGGECAAKVYERRLATENYHVAKWIVNTKDCGVPQSRSRLYLVVVRREAVRSPIPVSLPPWRRAPRLRDFMQRRAPESRSLTACQRRYLRQYLSKLKPKLMNERLKGSIAVFDVSRRPGGFRSDILINTIPTLTCRNTGLFLVGLGHGVRPRLCRFMTLAERVRLQGFRPSSVKPLEGMNLVMAMGNAFSVPVVATVLATALRALAPNTEARALRKRPAGDSQKED